MTPLEEVSNMNCHQCGNPLSGGAKFCPNCGEKVPASATPSAQILDFSQYIADRTRDFTGREWVFKVIDDWLGKSDGSRYFLLTNEFRSSLIVFAVHTQDFKEQEWVLVEIIRWGANPKPINCLIIIAA